MKKFYILARAGLLILPLAIPALADGDLLLRVDPSVVNSVAQQHNLKIEKQLKSGEGVYLVSVPKGTSPSAVLQSLRSDSLVKNAELNNGVTLTTRPSGPRSHTNQNSGCASTALLPANADPRYSGQTAIKLTCLGTAQRQYGSGNSGVHVAVIDTAVDSKHPMLQQVMDPGYDAITNQPGPVSTNQETSPFVDQETSPFVDSSGSYVLNQETSPFVDQETSPFVDQETSPFVDTGVAYGHGTMVAGIVHLVAPNVRIVPVRAFDNNGSGTMADVVQSIYWAVDNGADVINMSFSAPQSSGELETAIAYAISHKVICVASVSNSHSTAPVYPAALSKVIGVGATDQSDVAASFSDYGTDVQLAAPGVYIWSTYPGKLYARSDGTSFATPFVAGTAALLKSLNRSANPDNTGAALVNGTDPASGFVSKKVGRLDVVESINK